jgi:hypothetical protein
MAISWSQMFARYNALLIITPLLLQQLQPRYEERKPQRANFTVQLTLYIPSRFRNSDESECSTDGTLGQKNVNHSESCGRAVIIVRVIHPHKVDVTGNLAGRWSGFVGRLFVSHMI